MDTCRIVELPFGVRPQDLLAHIQDQAYPVLLDGRGGPNAGWSYVACNPCLILRNSGIATEIGHPDLGWKSSNVPPLDLLREKLAERHIPQPQPEIWTGAVGYVSYDFARQIEDLPDLNQQDVPTWNLHFAFYNCVACFDPQGEQWFLCLHPSAAREEEEFWKNLSPSPVALLEVRATLLQSNLSEIQFAEMVKKAKHYILEGDIFQANLSQRLELALETPPSGLYNRLLDINPSPFAAFMEVPPLTIGSCSPERLFRVQGRELSARPIAGTRRRGRNPKEDSAMYQELIQNEKERAEHLMLVDLERNDVGRVCRYGSVHVNEFMIREAYSHVWHLVSNVAGELREGKDALDALQAMFPGGTITGAPKIRSMEIIEELEPVRRGLYTGSIGYLNDSGDCDFNIVIRTFVVYRGKAYIQVGAGVVADSDPHREYQETFNKAAALLGAAGVEVSNA